jgi:hypothetical protein
LFRRKAPVEGRAYSNKEVWPKLNTDRWRFAQTNVKIMEFYITGPSGISPKAKAIILRQKWGLSPGRKNALESTLK